jgi:hypothetical protein
MFDKEGIPSDQQRLIFADKSQQVIDRAFLFQITIAINIFVHGSMQILSDDSSRRISCFRMLIAISNH